MNIFTKAGMFLGW